MAERNKFPKSHGLYNSHRAEYQCWQDMRQRCNNEKHKSFHNYGGRGISVCDRWGSFENFINDMGQRPDGRSLDRIDVDGNYDPQNCRWATATEQSRNLRAHKRNDVGVSYCKRDKYWNAHITVKGKSFRIGGFKTQEEAIRARAAAQNEYWTNSVEPTKASRNTSGFVGVSRDHRYGGAWEAYYYKNRKRIYVGRFNTAEMAAQARDAAISNHGIGGQS